MINLLPASQKEELRTDRAFAVVNLLGMVAVFVLISFSLVIMAVGVYFDGQLRVITIEAEGSAKQLAMMNASEIEKTMSGYDARCKELNNFYSRKVSPADVALLLVGALPQGVNLTRLSIVDKLININGISDNRANLVRTRDNLEKIPVFKDVNIPPSDWVGQENISFSATIKYDSGK